MAITTASAIVGMTILSPMLPIMRDEMGVSSSAVQQLLTMYMVALAVGQLFWGPVSDRFGRRPVLIGGAVLYTLAGLAIVFVEQPGLLILCRIIQGFGGAGCISMIRAIVNDAYARSEAARKLSTISMILALAPALSIAFGGVMAEYAGWKSTMLLLAASGVIITATSLRYVTETNLQRIKRISFVSLFTAYQAVLSNRLFICWCIAGGFQVGIFLSLNAVLAYQYQRLGYTSAEFGLWFSLTPLFYILGNTVNMKWFINRGLESASMTGCLLSLLSIIMLLLTQLAGMEHALSLALPCCLFGFSNGIVIANATVGAMSAAGQHAGTGTGIVGAFQMATGGIAGAVIVALGGAEHFWIAASVLILMSVIAMLCMSVVYRGR